MSERQIINRMKKLQELEEQEKKLKAEIAAVKQEIQDQMKNQETIKAGSYLIRWTQTVSERFDSKSFKEKPHKVIQSVPETSRKPKIWLFCIRIKKTP